MPKAFLRERICMLAPDRMSEICEALAIATGCR
jgi:mRNA-degrading endonuclease toxin of MazEF toxin-antitoxin module